MSWCHFHPKATQWHIASTIKWVNLTYRCRTALQSNRKRSPHSTVDMSSLPLLHLKQEFFTTCTDHKSLQKLLGEKSTPPPCIKRWLLQLQAYQYHLAYIQSQSNAADCLSRNPASVTDHDHAIDHHKQYITTNAQQKSCCLDNIQKATQLRKTQFHKRSK